MTSPWIETLRSRYPTPDVSDVDAYYFSLDGGGRDLVADVLRSLGSATMVEIGCFLCGSTIQWLEAAPQLTVVGVDPWTANFAAILERYRNNPTFDSCFAKVPDRDAFIDSVRRHGPFKSALANVAAYGERFVPVRAESPRILTELSELGAAPDIIYFDSNKLLDDLEVAHRLFPQARLCGDDWTWGAEQGYPVRAAVRSFCEAHGARFEARRATWMIELR
jgi:hypothetical protein